MRGYITVNEKPKAPIWQVYDGESIPFQLGDTLVIIAMRIGDKATKTSFIMRQ